MKMKSCIACGMPMKKASEFAMGDESKDYCVYCARPDGTMQSFEEKKENLTMFIIRTQGLSKDVAENAALAMMRKLPAWESNFS
ncbi:MAG: zinc ribbon domain-containing protein [Methanomassiliicoccaceae archaeon]|nr:zinc ribbon domain-containing protein [Methanomassiliicoccaceae archaeon]